MDAHFSTIKYNIAINIEKALKLSFPDNTEAIPDPITLMNAFASAPQFDMGHLAFGCFRLSKPLRKSPKDIALALAQNFSDCEYVEKAAASGPYLNFFYNFENVAKKICPAVLDGSEFNKTLVDKPKKTMVEYFQPNTHKEYHVGHMRNLCLGDSLIKLMTYAGVPIISSTFPGDVGTHVAKCLWYLKFHNKTAEPEGVLEKGAWLGKLYSNANNKLEDERGSDKEAENKEILTNILKELHAESGEYYELWKKTRQYSVALLDSVCKWANVEFDKRYWESEVDAPSVELVKKYLDSGLFVVDQGAVGIYLEEDKLGFCLLLKSDGTGLYATKDLELARRKFEDFQIERSLYVVDNRQERHFKQVFKTLEKMGFEQARDCHHIQYEMVELADGAMSSRKGNIIPLMELINKMEQTIASNYLAKYVDEWDQTEIKNTAHIVAQGAIKYGMIRMDNNKKIVFDMDEWLRLDGESGPYIQYAFARINNMCLKLGYSGEEEVDWNTLEHACEKKIIAKLLEFNDVVFVASEQFKPSFLSSYLFELSKLFNAFYSECPVGKADNKKLKIARLALAKSTSVVIEKGLSLLGIPVPQRM